MSDWQIPHGLASRVRGATYKDAWEREIERTVELRGILTDLITELIGDDGDGHELTSGEGDTCLVCEAIDRAEARLREVTDGE